MVLKRVLVGCANLLVDVICDLLGDCSGAVHLLSGLGLVIGLVGADDLLERVRVFFG